MSYLQKHYEKLSTEKLRTEYSLIQERIEENDGRLSTDSSANLDYDMDKRNIIDIILTKRYSGSI